MSDEIIKIEASDNTEIVESPNTAENRITPKSAKKPISKSTKKLIAIGSASVLGVFALFGGFGYYLIQGNDQSQLQEIANQQQSQPQNTEKQDTPPPHTALGGAPMTDSMPSLNGPASVSLNRVDPNAEKVHQEQEAMRTDGVVGQKMTGTMSFGADGEVYSAEKSAQSKEKKVSTESILANKALPDMTEDELMTAYQIVDFEGTQVAETQRALLDEMKKRKIEPPISQIEARQAIHDKAMIETVARELSEKIATQLKNIDAKIEAQNKAILAFQQETNQALQEMYKKINGVDIAAKKAENEYAELTKANQAILSKYTIKRILDGRVFIQSNGKVNNYVVGDNIGDDIVITSIDPTNYSISTTKGEIKSQLNY